MTDTTDQTSGANEPTGDNPQFFFNKFNADTARWLADLCDDVAAKGPATSAEWRRLFRDRLQDRLLSGESDAFHWVGLALANELKWTEKQYAKYDQARSAVIETGTGRDGSTPPAPGLGTPDNTTAGQNIHVGGESPGITTTGTASDTAGTGAGPGVGTGTTITAGTGCGGGRITGQETGGNTGIGHQGTLFVVRYSRFRLGFQDRRTKAKTEHKRLISVGTQVKRQTQAQKEILEDLDLIEKADALLEDLANKHRTEDTVSGILRSAGMTPTDLGLTDRAVAWLDTQLKAM
jgi:hypothetical protein